MLRRVRAWLRPAPRVLMAEQQIAERAGLERAARAVVTDPDVLDAIPEMLRTTSTVEEFAEGLHDALSADDIEALIAWKDERGGAP